MQYLAQDKHQGPVPCEGALCQCSTAEVARKVISSGRRCNLSSWCMEVGCAHPGLSPLPSLAPSSFFVCLPSYLDSRRHLRLLSRGSTSALRTNIFYTPRSCVFWFGSTVDHGYLFCSCTSGCVTVTTTASATWYAIANRYVSYQPQFL